MARSWIVVGDTTSSGGNVITGSLTDDIDGRPWAYVGCHVICGRHGATTIASGDLTTIVCDQPAARHGDYCACGCTLMFVQQNHAYVEDGGTRGITAKSPSSAKSSTSQPSPSSSSPRTSLAPNASNAATAPACWVVDHQKAISVDADGRYSETFDKNGTKHNYNTPRKFKIIVPIHTGGNLTVEVKVKPDAPSGVTAADITTAKTLLETGVATYWNNKFSIEIADQPCGIKTLPIEYEIVWVTSGEDYTMKVHQSYPREGVTGNVIDVSKATTAWIYAHEFGHCVGAPDEYSYTPDIESVQYYKADGTLDPAAISAPPLKPSNDPTATIMSSFGNTTMLSRHAWGVAREVQELLTRKIGRPIACNVI